MENIIVNTFYNAFDAEVRETRGSDYRTVFERDRDRVIHTPAFRKLQSKTQVFVSGEYDFYRTRLTHSLEVAQVGRSLCNFLNRTSQHLHEAEFFIDDALVEAACLSHDIGHPPFGHSGETKLNAIMADSGGFEGNAQTARLITETIYTDEDGRRGLNPSRAYLDSILKYKTVHSELDNPNRHFLYDDQAEYLQFVFGGERLTSHLAPGKEANSFRSIECQIMDWADDIAYSVTDIADGINAGFISERSVRRWFERKDDEYRHANQDLFELVLEAINSVNLNRSISHGIGDMINAVSLEEQENFMSGRSNRYRFKLSIDPEMKRISEFYKKVAVDIVFRSPQLQQLEHKGELLIERLFSTLLENYEKPKSTKQLLPLLYHTMVLEAEGDNQKKRFICDYLSGLTDDSLIKIYNRIFTPGYGSIVDLI